MAVFLIITAVLLVIYLVIWGMKYAVGEEYVRKNSVAPTQRVYDYADVLTDFEEEDLEKLIAKREAQISCDIVLVILNEPLAEYARGYEDHYGFLSESEYVMVYADNFYDEHAFGYDKPFGDVCVFVDNWDRSDSVHGYSYSYLLTSGRAENKLSDKMMDQVIDDVNRKISSPYSAYKSYVNNIYYYMSGNNMERVGIPFYVIAVIAAIVALVYLIANMAKNIGTKTTVGNTYVNGGRPKMNVMTDQFVRKSVTKRRIQSSSGGGGGGGGGGGHHTTSGGHSVGGRGGHR